MFIVKSLILTRKTSWASNPKDMGPLQGKLALTSAEEINLEFNLTAEQTQEILKLVAGALVTSAKGVSSMLTQDVLELENSETVVETLQLADKGESA